MMLDELYEITGKGVNLTGLLGGRKKEDWGTEVPQRGPEAEPS